MTQGVLLFAHDNEQIEYSLMAAWQAKRINKWLNKPVSLVTDSESLENLKKHNLDIVFDEIIITNHLTTQKKMYKGIDTPPMLTFKNVDRCFAWDLTPYEETIVIDTDIIIQSSNLNLLWGSNSLTVCKQSTHLFGNKYSVFEYLSDYGINFYWATIFYFKKDDESKLFFETCKRIRSQYTWYAFVYEVSPSYIRNDYVWSIALHELGLVDVNVVPYNLPFVLDKDSVVKLSDKEVTVFSENRLCNLKNIDIHVMNKFSLIQFVKEELNV